MLGLVAKGKTKKSFWKDELHATVELSSLLLDFIDSDMEICEIKKKTEDWMVINPLNVELNPICHLLALLGAHHILYVSRVWVKQETSKVTYNVTLKSFSATIVAV